MKVGVVGAGISGLANAFEAMERGHDVVVFERSARPGGNIRTEDQDGYIVEWGPNGFLDNVPETLDLIRRIDLEDRLQVSSDAARKRFIYRRGGLHLLPEKPPAFLRSPLLSPLGRARVLLEPLARSRPRRDESVHSFAARRIGREAADVLVQAMVSGVFGGDAKRLSLRSAFPKMYRMERDHGGLFRAMLAKKRTGGGGGPAGPGGTLTSFVGGMRDLVDALLDRLGDRLRLSTPVTALRADGPGFVLVGPEERVDRVVLSVPATEAAGILDEIARDAAGELRSIRGAPIVVVATAYDAAEIGGPPDGFGFLVPRGEGLRILGCLWTSSIYPGTRAPAGRVLLRTMIGGATDPAAADLGDGELLDTVARDLAGSMGLSSPPTRHWIFRHRKGIPQYEPGHGRALARVGRVLRSRPGIILAGNSYRGISVNAVVKEAAEAWM